MIIPSLTSLQLILPDLVLVSAFTGLGLHFVIMFASLSLVVILASLSSHAMCLNLAFWLYWMVVTSLLSSPITIWCIITSHMCPWACCKWSTYSPILCWHCLHKNILKSSSYFLYLFPEILLCSYWGAAYMLCVLHYQSAHLCHSDYVGSPSQLAVISFFGDSVCLCCMVTVDPMGKDSESF